MKPFHSLLAGLALLSSASQTVYAQTAEAFPNADYFVRVLVAQSDANILIGGDFSTIGGLSRGCLARVIADGSVDTNFNPIVGGSVKALAVQSDGKILVGGDFKSIGGQVRYSIARVNVDGSLDSGFNQDLSCSLVLSLALQGDGKILVGGGSINSEGQSRQGVARINSNSSLDAGFNPDANGYVYSLASQADGKILVGGTFTTIGGGPRHNLARLNADGTLDTGFNAYIESEAYTSVYSLRVQEDGKILVGGAFTTIGGQPRYSLARLNNNGSVDMGFNPTPNGHIHSIALQADGKILVGGSFNNIGGQPCNSRIARLNVDGSIDAGFNPNVSSTTVLSLALQTDGRILAGGNYFTGLGVQPNQPNNYLVRLANDTAATSSLFVTSSQIDWARGGSAPEISQVTFESWNGSAWISLGDATRVSGGWRLTGLNLPTSGQIRARGTSGSSSIIEQTTNYFVPFTNYSAWAAANAPDQTADQDHDRDGVPNGVEYFMGKTGNDFTANPGNDQDGTVTWPKSAAFSGR